MNKTEIKKNQKTMNKSSRENQTKYIYQGVDRVPLDIRGDRGGTDSWLVEEM
jgi:hypothetical protein